MAFKRQESLRRTRLAFSIFSITFALALTSIGIVNAADAPGTKGPIGTTGKTTTGVTGPVKGSTPTKSKGIQLLDINQLPRRRMFHSFIDELHQEEEEKYRNDLRQSFIGRR